MKSINFPIIERISTMGVVKQHEIREGSTVECLRCRQQFYADGDTASIGKHGNTYLTCPRCGYLGSTFFYSRQKPGRIVS